MPHKNTLRTYIANGYYHVYNRGVEKRTIFLEKQDFDHFLQLIESYLVPQPPPPDKLIKNTPYWRSILKEGEVTLLCFCLLANHFHLILKQRNNDGITKFMRRISNAYVRYFNKKYHRVGGLFQGKFKSVLIDNESYLLHLSRYIHQNPEVRPLDCYVYSSYHHYLRKPNPPWINPQEILSYFSANNPNLSYKSFVEEISTNTNPISDLTLDEKI